VSKNQRFLCRFCGFRFTNTTSILNTKMSEIVPSQKNVPNGEGMALAALEANKTSAGTESHAQPDIKGAIAQFTAKMITMGLAKETIERNLKSLKLLQEQGANLADPENTFKTLMIARKYREPKREKVFSEEPWSAGTKSIVARSYFNFCKISKISDT